MEKHKKKIVKLNIWQRMLSMGSFLPFSFCFKGLSVLCVVSFQKTSDDIFFTFFFPGEDRIFSDSNSEDSASSRQRPAEETVMEVTTPPIV